jgi:molybdate transport system substrate-binding protein
MLLPALLSAGFVPSAGVAQSQEVLVFAAASQKDALDAVIEEYAKGGGPEVKAAYASSSTLARQIEQGAPADVFISANPKWMDYLQERDLIETSTRTDLLGNGLVLVAPKESQIELKVAQKFDLAGALGDRRLAMGDPDHVPAGIYGKQALQSLGVWSSVEGKLARADNVRVALALVSRGETPLGIVYGSDAVADDTVRVVDTFPGDSHAPIIYPVAVTAETENREAAVSFLDFLKSPEAAAIFERCGFRVLN